MSESEPSERRIDRWWDTYNAAYAYMIEGSSGWEDDAESASRAAKIVHGFIPDEYVGPRE